MTALTQSRNTPSRPGLMRQDPVAAGVRIFLGAIVLLDAAGNAVSNATGAGLHAVGRAKETADNRAGIAGDAVVDSEGGVFGFAHDGSLTRGHIGKSVFVLDDQTLSATDQAGTRTATVTLTDLQGATAWVRLGL